MASASELPNTLHITPIISVPRVFDIKKRLLQSFITSISDCSIPIYKPHKNISFCLLIDSIEKASASELPVKCITYVIYGALCSKMYDLSTCIDVSRIVFSAYSLSSSVSIFHHRNISQIQII
eukprot:205521_1